MTSHQSFVKGVNFPFLPFSFCHFAVIIHQRKSKLISISHIHSHHPFTHNIFRNTPVYPLTTVLSPRINSISSSLRHHGKILKETTNKTIITFEWFLSFLKKNLICHHYQKTIYTIRFNCSLPIQQLATPPSRSHTTPILQRTERDWCTSIPRPTYRGHCYFHWNRLDKTCSTFLDNPSY